MGFDGSRPDDATAVVLCRIDDGLLDLAAVWERPDGPAGDGWEVPRAQVDDLLVHLFARHEVVAFYADVYGWESYIEVVGALPEPVAGARLAALGWDMRARVAEFTRRGAEMLNAAIVDRALRHTGHPALRVLNARRRPIRWGVSFGKERRESAWKVDALAAVGLACIARADVLAGPPGKPERSGEVWAL